MTLFDLIFDGNNTVYERAEREINEAVAKYGEDKAVAFPGTAYSLPFYYSMTGKKIGNLREVKEAMPYVKSLMTRNKRTADIFSSGIATGMCAEFIEVLKYIDNDNPYEAPYVGFLNDAYVREQGVPLVVDDIPGVPVLLGEAPSAQEAYDLVKEYQGQGMLITLTGKVAKQCIDMGLKTGHNLRTLPLGEDTLTVINAVSVAVRVAMIFGNVEPGDAEGIMAYTFKRLKAFVNALGHVDNITFGCGACAIAHGFPVITKHEAAPERSPGGGGQI